MRKKLTAVERNYPRIEKLAYILLIASRKLRHYFQAHPITIYTDHPLKQVLQRPEASGRLLKWNIELSQFDLNFQPRRSIRGQVIADFIAEFTVPEEDIANEEVEPSKLLFDPNVWRLYTDGARNNERSGAGIVLETPEKRLITYAIRMEFQATNNDSEYEALIARLKIAKVLEVTKLNIFCDSKLVVNQVTG